MLKLVKRFSNAPLRPSAALALAAVLLAPAVLSAAPLCEEPKDRQVLRIHATNAAKATFCDLKGLEKLPSAEIVTALPPSLGLNGEFRWKGVPLRVLVERMGGNERSEIRLTALNDYSVQVPWSDLVQYEPIVAYARNEKPMGVREKGPLMLIYPFDRHVKLQGQEYVNRAIWQINAIQVR